MKTSRMYAKITIKWRVSGNIHHVIGQLNHKNFLSATSDVDEIVESRAINTSSLRVFIKEMMVNHMIKKHEKYKNLKD